MSFNSILILIKPMCVLFFTLLLIPISNYQVFYVFLFIITIITFSVSKNKFDIKKIFFGFIVLLLLVTILSPNKIKFDSSIVLLNKNSYDYYKKKLPQEIYDFFSNEFKFYFNNSKCESANERCWKNFNPNYKDEKFIDFKSNNIKKVKDFNVKNIKSIKLNEINSLRYNYFWGDKYDIIRENIPFVISLNISKELNNGKICWKGTIFWEKSFNKFDKNYNKKYKCKKINENDIQKRIYAISLGTSESIEELKKLYGENYINKDDELYNFLKKNELTLKVIKTNFSIIYESFTFILVFLFIIFLLNEFFFLKFRILCISFLFPFLYFLILYYTNNELFNGFNIYTGGNDGLVYESYGNKLFQYLSNYNVFEFFRGIENVFYFPSSIRYFYAFNKLIFFDSFYGYISIGYFLILILYFIFKEIFSLKLTLIFLFIIVFTRVFEGYALSLYKMLMHINEGDAEPLAIFFLLVSLFMFILNINNYKLNKLNHFVFGFCIFLSISLRPNYLPTGLFLFIINSYELFNRNKYQEILYSMIGISFVSLIPLHNYIYGNAFVLLSSGASHNHHAPINIYFVSLIDIFNLNFNSENIKRVLYQLSRWIKPFEIHYLLSFSIIIITLVGKNFKLEIKYISILALSQHFVLLIYEPDNRYAYLAWALTFIVVYYFFIILFKNFSKYYYYYFKG